MKLRVSALATGFLLAVVCVASAGQYTDPTGFSFTYPDGWVSISKLSQAALPQELKGWMSKNHIDLSKVSVVVAHPSQSDFYENLNVVVTAGDAPIDEDSCRQLRSVIPQQLRMLGVTIENVDAGVQQLGANKAIVVEFQSRMPGVTFPLRQCQFYMSSGGKTFIVTCTAKASTFSQFAPTFVQMAASFKLPGGSQQSAGRAGISTPAGDQWAEWKSHWLMGLIVGGVAGMIGAAGAALKSARMRSLA